MGVAEINGAKDSLKSKKKETKKEKILFDVRENKTDFGI